MSKYVPTNFLVTKVVSDAFLECLMSKFMALNYLSIGAFVPQCTETGEFSYTKIFSKVTFLKYWQVNSILYNATIELVFASAFTQMVP